MIMTYGYRDRDRQWRAPSPRWTMPRATSSIHITRILQWAPAELDPARRALLRLRLAGHEQLPNATVQANKTTYGAVKTITYAGARDVPRRPPEVVRQYDAARGQRLLHVPGRDQEDLAAGLLRGRAEPRREVRLRADDAASAGSASGRSTTTAAIAQLWNVLQLEVLRARSTR